nr:MAG TPA: collagen triple helix repeat protein [Caudoviricetes sp.]
MTTANRVVPDRYGVINIGKLKENLVTEVSLPAPGFAGGSYAVLLKRPKEEQPYPVSARHDGSNLVWTVQTADTAIAGMGKLECRWYGDNGEVAKSETYMVRIKDGLPDPTEAPEAWAGFMQQVSQDAGRAESAADNAAKTLKKLEDGITSGDFRGEKGEQGEKGDPGPQGPKGEAGPAGDTTAADAAAAAAKQAAQEAQKAAEASAGSAAQAAESVGGLADDLEANQKDIAKMKRAIKFQAQLNKGQTWDFEEDAQIAYQRIVPSGAKAGAVMAVGGKTVVWNQQWKALTRRFQGVVVTANADGSCDISGVFDNSLGYGFFPCGGEITWDRVSQHVYLLVAPKGFDRGFGVAGYGGLSAGASNLAVWKAPKAETNWVNSMCIVANKSDTLNYQKLRFAAIDLTLLYGPGNEPTDTTDPRIAQIEAYAAAHPEYNSGELVSAQVDEVRVRGKNLANIVISDISRRGVTLQSNGNGTYTITGTASDGQVSFESNKFKLKKGKTYKLVGTPTNGSLATYYSYIRGASDWTEYYSEAGGRVFTAKHNEYRVGFTVKDGNTVSGVIWAPMVTEDTAATYDDYSPYREDLYPIPATVRNLPGYGWSAGSVANTVERTENGWQYVQRVGCVDLGTLQWGYSASKLLFSANVDGAVDTGNSGYTKLECAVLMPGKAFLGNITDGDGEITINHGIAIARKMAYDNVEDFTSYVSGHPLYYELATPITTDITALMGDALAPFAVEAGGSITMHHPKADEGFAIDVPAKIQYITKLSEVSANG